jgi:hypothetical protein
MDIKENLDESISSESSQEDGVQMEKERREIKQLMIRKKLLDNLEYFGNKEKPSDDISVECDVDKMETHEDEDSFCLELDGGPREGHGDVFIDLRNLKNQIMKLPKMELNTLKLYELCVNKINKET